VPLCFDYNSCVLGVFFTLLAIETGTNTPQFT